VSQSDGTATTTLVIAVIGLVLAVASIVWQAAAFRLSGARVKVQLREGALGHGYVATGPPGTQPMSALARQGFDTEILAVLVRNKSRMPITVERVQARFETGMAIGHTVQVGQTTLPHRLEGGASDTWFVDMGTIRRVIPVLKTPKHEHRSGMKVRMEVELGDGTIKKTGYIQVASAEVVGAS
jgi:hypothetical protein